MDAPCFEGKKYFCCIEILRAIQAFETKGLRKISRMQINFLGVHRNLFWQLSTDGNLHGSGMSLVTTSSQTYPSGHLGGWTTPWWVKEMRDGQRQRVDIPAHEEKAWRESVLNRPSHPPPLDDLIGQGIKLNWTYNNYTKPINGNVYVSFYVFGSTCVFPWGPVRFLDNADRIACVTCYPGSLCVTRHEMQVT